MVIGKEDLLDISLDQEMENLNACKPVSAMSCTSSYIAKKKIL